VIDALEDAEGQAGYDAWRATLTPGEQAVDREADRAIEQGLASGP
jgi:hypothetical protein